MPTASIEELFPRCYDTLRMARLLHPELKQHKLRHLLAVLELEGSNTHMADDDVDATVSLIAHLCERTRAAMEGQRKFLDEKRVQTRAELLHRNYSKLYNHSRAILYHRPEHTGGEPAIVSEMRYIYRRLLDDGTIQRLDGIERGMKFITTDIIGDTIPNTPTTTQQQENNRGISLVEQIDSHIMEINTLKEADLAGGISSDDKVLSLLSESFINRQLFRGELLDAPLSEADITALNDHYAQAFGLDPEDASYLWSEHVSTSNTYSEKADTIDILYSDGTVRDIAEASEILDLAALTRKPIKRYVFKLRTKN